MDEEDFLMYFLLFKVKTDKNNCKNKLQKGTYTNSLISLLYTINNTPIMKILYYFSFVSTMSFILLINCIDDVYWYFEIVLILIFL